MAWETGIYSCGHDGREQFYGKRKEREYAVKKHFERLCPECWKAERDKKAADDAEKNKAAALPPLVGSDKQIPWAESIRAKVTGKEDFIFALQNTSAKWWIDHRDNLEGISDYAIFMERMKYTDELVKKQVLPIPEKPLSLDGMSKFEMVNFINDYIDKNRTDKVVLEKSNPVPF